MGPTVPRDLNRASADKRYRRPPNTAVSLNRDISSWSWVFVPRGLAWMTMTQYMPINYDESLEYCMDDIREIWDYAIKIARFRSLQHVAMACIAPPASLVVKTKRTPRRRAEYPQHTA